MARVSRMSLAKELCDLIRQHVAAVTKPLRDRIEALEKQARGLQILWSLALRRELPETQFLHV